MIIIMYSYNHSSPLLAIYYAVMQQHIMYSGGEIGVTCKVTWGKWEVGVNRRNGKCVTNAASTTDWPHCIA